MERIKEIRQNLGLTRTEFSQLYEIPYNTLAQWERGERSAPGYVIKLIEEIIKLRTNREQLSIYTGIYTEKLYIIEYQTIYAYEKSFSCYETERKRNQAIKCFFSDEKLYKYIKTYEVNKTPI